MFEVKAAMPLLAAGDWVNTRNWIWTRLRIAEMKTVLQARKTIAAVNACARVADDVVGSLRAAAEEASTPGYRSCPGAGRTCKA